MRWWMLVEIADKSGCFFFNRSCPHLNRSKQKSQIWWMRWSIMATVPCPMRRGPNCFVPSSGMALKRDNSLHTWMHAHMCEHIFCSFIHIAIKMELKTKPHQPVSHPSPSPNFSPKHCLPPKIVAAHLPAGKEWCTEICLRNDSEFFLLLSIKARPWCALGNNFMKSLAENKFCGCGGLKNYLYKKEVTIQFSKKYFFYELRFCFIFSL